MPFVEDRVVDWSWEFMADKFEWTLTEESERRGCHMNFGNLTVSIQWSNYNYCDNYPNINAYVGSWDKPILPSVTAEVAVFFKGRYRTFGYGNWHTILVETPGGDTVWGYAEQNEIAEILKVCHIYSMNGHGCQCMYCYQ